MAKKATKKKTGTRGPDNTTTTYSTRLSQTQRELVEQASQIADVSPSKFIRDAAIRAAADTINAAPPQSDAVAELARKVVKLATDAEIRIDSTNAASDTDTHHYSARAGRISLDHGGPEWHDQFTPQSVEVSHLREYERRALRQMAESCPLALAQAIKDALTKPEIPVEYKPRIDLKNIEAEQMRGSK